MEVKQSQYHQVQRYRPLALATGFLISLGLIKAAFDYSFKAPDTVQLSVEDTTFDLPIVPRTTIEPPQPPTRKNFKLISVEDPEEVEIQDIPFSFEFEENDVIEDVVFIDDKPEVAEKIFLIVQEEASFPGGNSAWLTYLKQNFNYPKNAARMGIEGRVFLQFTVASNGSISDIEVIRGIGGGCDEEAIRVLKNSPSWNPGKQRGVPVKSKRTIAIVFKLQ